MPFSYFNLPKKQITKMPRSISLYIQGDIFLRAKVFGKISENNV